MFSELVAKLFDMQVTDEDTAKAIIIDYAKKVAPNLTDDEIVHIMYNYTGLYSFENTIEMAGKNKARNQGKKS